MKRTVCRQITREQIDGTLLGYRTEVQEGKKHSDSIILRVLGTLYYEWNKQYKTNCSCYEAMINWSIIPSKLRNFLFHMTLRMNATLWRVCAAQYVVDKCVGVWREIMNIDWRLFPHVRHLFYIWHFAFFYNSIRFNSKRSRVLCLKLLSCEHKHMDTAIFMSYSQHLNSKFESNISIMKTDRRST